MLRRGCATCSCWAPAWPGLCAARDLAAAGALLAATVDAADPWRHPDAAALDAISLAAWLRRQGARPAVLRLH